MGEGKLLTTRREIPPPTLASWLAPRKAHQSAAYPHRYVAVLSFSRRAGAGDARGRGPASLSSLSESLSCARRGRIPVSSRRRLLKYVGVGGRIRVPVESPRRCTARYPGWTSVKCSFVIESWRTGEGDDALFVVTKDVGTRCAGDVVHQSVTERELLDYTGVSVRL